MVQGGFIYFLETYLDMDILWGENKIMMITEQKWLCQMRLLDTLRILSRNAMKLSSI